jgi:hypothetical protein
MMMTDGLLTRGFSGSGVTHYSLSAMTVRETDSASMMSFQKP